MALLQGHGGLSAGLTRFRNGLVSDGWIEKGSLFAAPVTLDRVAAQQARAVAQAFPDATLLVGAPACGAVPASAVARHLGCRVAYVLLQPEAAWHRMNIPKPPERVVYIDDLICTGQDACLALHFLRQEGHTVLGVSAWISRAALSGEQLVTLAPPPFRLLDASELGPDSTFEFQDIRE